MKIEEMEKNYRSELEKLEVFDVNAWWDASPLESFTPFETFADCLTNLGGHGIKEAILTCAEGYKYDALSGNEATAKLIADRAGLFGAMTLYPDLLIAGHAAEYIAGLVKQGFCIARMFPKKYFHSMEDYCVGGLLAILQQMHVPLMLWHSETGFDGIHALCTRYPQLPIIIEGNEVKLLYHARNYISLLSQHENLYIETHNLVLFDEIANLVQKFGAARLIFGSYFPYNTPAPSLYNIMMAGISEAEKKQICGGNIRRLIAGITR